MTSLFMLDTNMVSYIVRGRSGAARSKMLNLKTDEIGCISAITEGEIRYGLSIRGEATALKSLMDDFLASVRILPWGSSEAKAYGTVRSKLQKSGKVLGHMDMLIAAHAVSVGAVLVTNDNAFRHVEDIGKIANWATDLQ